MPFNHYAHQTNLLIDLNGLLLEYLQFDNSISFGINTHFINYIKGALSKIEENTSVTIYLVIPNTSYSNTNHTLTFQDHVYDVKNFIPWIRKKLPKHVGSSFCFVSNTYFITPNSDEIKFQDLIPYGPVRQDPLPLASHSYFVSLDSRPCDIPRLTLYHSGGINIADKKCLAALPFDTFDIWWDLDGTLLDNLETERSRETCINPDLTDEGKRLKPRHHYICTARGSLKEFLTSAESTIKEYEDSVSLKKIACEFNSATQALDAIESELTAIQQTIAQMKEELKDTTPDDVPEALRQQVIDLKASWVALKNARSTQKTSIDHLKRKLLPYTKELDYFNAGIHNRTEASHSPPKIIAACQKEDFVLETHELSFVNTYETKLSKAKALEPVLQSYVDEGIKGTLVFDDSPIECDAWREASKEWLEKGLTIIVIQVMPEGSTCENMQQDLANFIRSCIGQATAISSPVCLSLSPDILFSPRPASPVPPLPNPVAEDAETESHHVSMRCS